MYSKELLFVAWFGLLGGLRLTSTTTTTTFVAAMSIANQDLERYFRSANATQTLATMSEERIAMDIYTYAFLSYSYNTTQPVEVSFDEEQARYGEGKIMNVRGKLVHITDAEDVNDDTACTPNVLGTRGVATPPMGVTWIALVRRGRCTFEEKVKNVYSKGASAVIIYNDKPVANLEKMQIKGKHRNITAVITYQKIGLDMAQIVDQGIDMNAAIIEGRNGMRPINSMNRTSVLFVSISFIVLMVISLVWLIFYYIQRFRYLQTKDQQSRHLCSVTKKAIMKIPTKTGKSSDEKDADSDCCAICIEAYKASDCIRVLPCKHEFHKNCIDPWLIEHRTCPMCKLDVLKFYGYVVGDQIQSTPSPQHLPPLVDDNNHHNHNNHGDDDVHVDVVDGDANDAVPVIAIVPPHAPLSHHLQQLSPQHLQAEQPNSSSISHNCNNSSSNSNSSNSNNSSSKSHNDRSSDSNCQSCNTCSDDNGHSCSCRGGVSLYSNQHIHLSASNNSSNNSSNEDSSSRRNSAPPLVMQVSTASRQVTDV